MRREQLAVVVHVLASVLKVALGAALVAGGLVGVVYINAEIERSASLEPSAPPEPNQSAIDYNCSLPGMGYPWLRQDLSYTVQFTTSAVFVSTVPDVSPWAAFLPISIAGDGTALSMDDVYRRLCRVHPQLGGGGLTRVSTEVAKQLVCGGQDRCLQRECDDFPDLYTDRLPLTVDEARMCLEPIRMYWLPPIPQDLRDALATAVASGRTPGPSSAPTPAPSGETRRYRITVNGYENVFYWNIGERLGVRFDYRLIGEFALVRPTPTRPWTVTSRRVITADLKYTSLYPADRYEVTLDCVRRSRSCEGHLIRSTTLRLRVQVDGDEIIARWGAFRPEVLVTGRRTDPLETVRSSYISEYFDDAVAAERLPLRDQYVGPQRVKTYQGRSDISTSYAYRLDRLP